MSVECLCDDTNFQIILKHEKLTLEMGAFVHGSRCMGWEHVFVSMSACMSFLPKFILSTNIGCKSYFRIIMFVSFQFFK